MNEHEMSGKEGWGAGSHGARRLLVTILMLAVVPIGKAQMSDTCPCRVWPSSAIPMTIDEGDGAATELGLRFGSDVTGYITGIRFCKAPTNTGARQVSLWTNTGMLLGTGTSAGQSSSGWEEADFATSVAIAGGTRILAWETNAPEKSDESDLER